MFDLDRKVLFGLSIALMYGACSCFADASSQSGDGATGVSARAAAGPLTRKPNVVFVLADQWRGQACGYAGDPNLQGKTPTLDRLATEGALFTYAVSGSPVCTPYRASLITGQYPLRNGVFLNDVCLSTNATSIAQAYAQAGYDTAYIGKWHLDGHGRSAYIPPERRQGFDYWKVLECTHNYNRSLYYAGNDPTQRIWDGYDAFAQTRDAQSYIRERATRAKPFLLILSWGPPHNPYETAPERFKALFAPEQLTLRENVSGDSAAWRRDLAGYYAHIAALDESLDHLLRTIDDSGLRDNTLVVFTSDHGDMLGSHGQPRKQKPWDESILVPLLIRGPSIQRQVIEIPINTPDLMPTLLGVCGVPIPASVQGDDFSLLLQGAPLPADNPVLIQCPSPFGEWTRARGGREYRGVRTRRYTYVRDLKGPWLLYDNETDSFQLNNLVNDPQFADVQARLEEELRKLLAKTGDDFQPGATYIAKWGYAVDEHGTVRYK